ncbi:MerR family transcriptional regulator [Marinobacter sp.]|uniref:MerR family transcriptional regulator n=1 Tax=Marinobacter sp. TaxID=50741 RepID=UPI002B27C096|nr:MerR family transcriptional regulator [Marinobacter sp.]
MKIGALSQQADVPVENIRYYEKIELMPRPERGKNGYRSYRKAHLERLQELASLEQTLVSLQRACSSTGSISD